MKSLQELWDEHDGRLIDRWQHYLPIHERYFAKFRNTACRILEIGVAHGGSLQLWKAYFGPEAKIMGIDYDVRCKDYEAEQIEIFIGNQADPDFLRKVGLYRNFDIVIDDGSHQLADQQASLDALWPKLNEGGVYLIEDLHEGRYPIVKDDAYSLNYYPWVMVMEKGSQEMTRIVTGKPSRPLNAEERQAYAGLVPSHKACSFSFLEKPGADPQAFAHAAHELYSAYRGPEPFKPPYSCLNPIELLTLCKKAARAPAGAFVEVGTFWGGSAYHLTEVARQQERAIYLYDTFEGMPNKSAIDEIGIGDIKADEAVVRDWLGAYPTIVKCVFPHTDQLPEERIAFAHIDCDQYQSIMESCRALEPLMVKGGILWFDDVPENGGVEGARQAVKELYAGRIQQDSDSDRWYVTC